MGIWVRRWDWEAVSKDGPQQSESRSSRERGGARSVGPTDAQIEIRWVQRRRRLGSGDDGEGVTKAPQKKKDVDAKESRERVEREQVK